MKCEKCVYYNKPLFRRPRCVKIRNVNFLTKKDIPVELDFGQKVCKGYFFTPKDNNDIRGEEWSQVSEQVLQRSEQEEPIDQGI